MPPHISKSEIVWPDLDSSYVDEFGFIDRAVYDMARELWPRAVPSILRTVRDLHAGQTLMLKAAALVSRKLSENPEQIANVHGYLYRTFIRLLNDEVAKEGKHAEFNQVLLTRNEARGKQTDSGIFNRILISQILPRVDPRTRILFRLRILGHTFEEIAKRQNRQSNHVRSEWSKLIRRLAAVIKEKDS